MHVYLVGFEAVLGSSPSRAAASLAALSKALRLLDHEVTVVAPFSPAYAEAGMLIARRLTPLELPSGAQSLVYETGLPTGAQLILLETKGSVDPPGSEAETRRFAEAAVRLMAEKIQAGTGPDVVHGFGARAAAVLTALKQEDGAVGRVLTVYDPAEADEGVVRSAEALVLPSDFSLRQLKGANQSALDGEGALGRCRLYAVAEGVDTAVFNSATDPGLPFRYDPHDLTGKSRTRTALLVKLGIDPSAERPVLLLDLFGADKAQEETVLRSVPSWVRQGLSVLVRSTVEPTELGLLLSALPGEVARVPADDRSFRQALGAADFYYSCAEAHQLGALFCAAHRYGAVPVASRKGPTDSLVDVDAQVQSGTAFLHDAIAQDDLTALAGRLVAAFRRPNWPRLVRRVLVQDHAWDRPARRYAQIYRSVLSTTVRVPQDRRSPAVSASV